MTIGTISHDPRGELILTEADMAINKLAASCRENILRHRRNRQAGQRRRGK